MRIGYMKLGRIMRLTSSDWGMVGGDQEGIILLRKLAARYPQHTFVLTGRNTGEDPADIHLPPNVENPWRAVRHQVKSAGNIKTSADARKFCDESYRFYVDMMSGLDTAFVWSGQHGTSNNSIPMVGSHWGSPADQFTKPQSSFLNYSSYIIRGINEMRDRTNGKVEEVWACTDSRNTIKCRDLKWPVTRPVLALYNDKLLTKHDRWGDSRDPAALGFDGSWWVGVDDPGVWYSKTNYVYSGVEVATLLPAAERMEFNINSFDERRHFGMIINEARAYVALDRLAIVKDWVMPVRPMFIHGVWSEESMVDLGVKISPVSHLNSFKRLETVKCTLTTPSSGSGWATRKALEAFVVGAICFFHPAYDTQGNILPTIDMLSRRQYSPEVIKLTTWLRCSSPDDFKARVVQVHQSRDLWQELASLQRQLYVALVKSQLFLIMLDSRLTEVEQSINALNLQEV